MPISQEDLENALVAWVRQGSGLPEGSVYLLDQRAGQAEPPTISIRIGSLVPVGMDSHDHEFDPDGAAGEEITETATGLRSMGVYLQADFPRSSGAAAAFMLSKVQSILATQSVRDSLHAAGLSAYDRGAVQNLSGLGAPEFMGRAALEVAFYVNEEVTAKLTYIEKVGFSTTLPGGETFEVE